MKRVSSISDRGFTLVELLVVIVLASVLGTLTLMGTTRASQGTRQVQERVTAETELERVMQRVTRDLRSADPLLTATAGSLSMTLYRDGKCYELHLETVAVGGSVQLRQRTRPLSPAPTEGLSLTACTTKGTLSGATVILSGLASSNVFAYQTRGGGAPSTVPDVASVAVTLTKTLPEGRPALTKTTRVTLRNQGTDVLRSS